MADQTGGPTYDELMKENIQLKEKTVRITSEAERREERLAAERDEARARAAEWEAHHARLVEDMASTVRRFSAALDERDHYRAETERLHQVAAAECDTIADYLDELASLADGPLAANLATAYRSAALAVRGRAGRHRDPGVADPPQANAAAEREVP